MTRLAVRVGRGTDAEDDDCDDSRALAIGLERLTRSEAQTYLDAKLAAGGCRDRVFTPGPDPTALLGRGSPAGTGSARGALR